MRTMRAIASTIAQALLLFIFIPIFALICEAFNSTSAVTGIIGFLGQVPLCGTIADILSQYVNGFTQNDLADITLWTFFKEFPSAILAGLSVHFCVSVFNHSWSHASPSNRPLPILAGFVGIFLSTILSNLIALLGNDFIVFLSEIVVLVVLVVCMRRFLLKKNISNVFSLKRVLLWIIEGLYAVILSVYVSGMMLIMQSAEPINAYTFIAMLAGATIIASVLVLLARRGVDQDER